MIRISLLDGPLQGMDVPAYPTVDDVARYVRLPLKAGVRDQKATDELVDLIIDNKKALAEGDAREIADYLNSGSHAAYGIVSLEEEPSPDGEVVGIARYRFLKEVEPGWTPGGDPDLSYDSEMPGLPGDGPDFLGLGEGPEVPEPPDGDW